MNMVVNIAATSTLSITNVLKFAYKIILLDIDRSSIDIKTFSDLINRPAQETCRGRFNDSSSPLLKTSRVKHLDAKNTMAFA